MVSAHEATVSQKRRNYILFMGEIFTNTAPSRHEEINIARNHKECISGVPLLCGSRNRWFYKKISAKSSLVELPHCSKLCCTLTL